MAAVSQRIPFDRRLTRDMRLCKVRCMIRRNLTVLSLLLLLLPRHAVAEKGVNCPTVDLGSEVFVGDFPIQESLKGEWATCQSNDQCVLAWGGCRDIAINKAYIDRFKPSTDCKGIHVMPHYPNAIALCSHALCYAAVPPSENCQEFSPSKYGDK